MYNEDIIEIEDKMNVFTIRLDPEAQSRIEYLKRRKNLNKTALLRLGLAELYQRERAMDANISRC